MSLTKDKSSEEKKKIKEKEDKKKKEQIVSTRPQRQRKLPKRWEDANLEVDLKVLDYANSNETTFNSKLNDKKNEVEPQVENLNNNSIKNKENEVLKVKENIISEKNKIEEETQEDNQEESDDNSDVDNEWESDDDPDKLWCICRKPHDNRFMISCDKCKEWFHGSCVGVTQAKGAAYEKLEKKWFCTKCTDTLNNDRRSSLTKKIKPKSEKKVKPIPIEPESIKSDSIEIKKPNEFVNKEKLKMSKNISEDKVQEQKLKDLIKTKKLEFNNKLNSSLNSSNTSIKSNDSDSKTDSELKVSDSEKSKSDKNCLKEDKKKRNNSLSLDPTFNDLFKAEPVIVQKKSTSTNISSKRASFSENTLNCANSECKKTAQKINNKDSVYCSKECIEKLVNNSISLVKQIKLSLAKTKLEKKSIEKDDKKVTLIEKKTGKYLSGSNAISEDKILDFIKNNPTFEILVPLNRKNSSNEEKNSSITSSKKLNNSLTTSSKKSKEKQKEYPDKKVKLSESETVRKNARKNLKRIFSTRMDTCKDIHSDKDEIKKIASKIEFELFSLYKEVNLKYKTRIRSLIFNLSDTKNEGLFKKVLTKKITADKLVRMGPEELASPELAKWRERENRHSLEMIKKDAEQQAIQVIVKKTHKGEEMIETKVQLPVFEETKKLENLEKVDDKKISSKPTKVVSAQEKTRTNPLDLLFKDTTSEHGQHLFDLHCNICTKQTKEDLSLVHKPKPLSTFEKNLLESVNSNAKDSKTEKNLNGSIETENQIDLNKEQVNQKQIHSCWNGFINMQDVSKFMAFAYKVSGFFESQDIFDNIQVCGRIAPEQVFYYLKKLKYSSRNEILVLKFIPANDEEKIGYESFFNYLNHRKRFGVVGNSGKAIKDFYILPLAKDQNVPEILLPFDGIGLEKKNHRPNLLLGILVRSRKHFSETKSDDKQAQTSFTNAKFNMSSNMSDENISNKRSYTPPPVFNSKSLSENSNSNSIDEVSYTPPRNNDSKDLLDEPYDPEETFLDLPIKKLKSEDNTIVKKEPSTKCLANLLEHLSKNSNSFLENGPSTELFDEIKKTTTSKQQNQLLEELKNRVEESKKKLEIQRKAAENALNVATGSCFNFDSNVIPGLDGDFSSLNQMNDSDNINLTKDLDLPDNLKEFLYKFKNEEYKKINTYDDPIVKNFGSKDFDSETNFKNNLVNEEPEPMELDEENATNTIIEVNNFESNSNIVEKDEKNFSHLDDDELVKKAKMQLEALKQMEHEQKNLIFAQQKAIALVNQTKSKSNSD